MIKREKGITLASLIIAIAIMLIITSTTIYISFDRFEVNNLNKLSNDIELLEDKVSNYYLKYGVLPVLRETISNNPIKYDGTLNFVPNTSDNENYYIIDLSAMEGISLNYGKEGYERPNLSDDVYIINEYSHQIYYVRGIELDGEKYYYKSTKGSISNAIPPTKPQINVISGKKNSEGIYVTEVEVEIIPGKSNLSKKLETTYSIDGGEEKDIQSEGNIFMMYTSGTITAKSYDENNNISSATLTIEIKQHTLDSGTVTLEATCTEEGEIIYECTECGEIVLAEAIPASGHSYNDGEETIKATCESEGEMTYTCIKCGGGVYTQVISPNGHHSYDGGNITRTPTCTEEGEITYTCIACGYKYSEPIIADGHNEADVEIREPYCGQVGERIVRCSICRELLYTEIIPAEDGTHFWNEYIDDDCCRWVYGTKTRLCSMCGATETIPDDEYEEECTPDMRYPFELNGITMYPCKFCDQPCSSGRS